ncbi:MAG: hypothetical protein JNL67_19665 [Planctomycetaceae bacterium]|nr:hypothetical protein [Planctomycetaceae bacterium]
MFVENPLTIVILGTIACLTPLVLWTHTGQSGWLKLLLVGICFFAGLLTFERWYETDRESLYRTIYHYRDLVRKNEIDELLTHLDERHRAQVGANLKKYRFTNCNVTQLSRDPKFDVREGVTTAEIEFLATGTVADLGTGGPIRVRLQLNKIGPGTWKVMEVSHARMGSDDFEDAFRNL